MRKLVAFVVLLAAVAVAQTITKVDQGKPGTQGPWPVTFSGTVPVVIVDGGVSGGGSGTATVTDAGVSVTVQYCTVSRSSVSSVGTSVTAVPADGGLAGRWMTRVCNSPRNSGTPTITCGTTADLDAGLFSNGDALETGDCAIYSSGEVVYCISDTAATAATTWECR